MNASGDRPVVVLAADKFKGSLTAAEVHDALAVGIERRWAELVRTGAAPTAAPVVRRVPVADGGDGTLDALLASGFRAVPVTVTGPLGDPVTTSWGRRGDVAVVELASCSGLLRLPRPPSAATALAATTHGTGEALAAALDAGCRTVLVGLGGSSSTDGGAGLLRGVGRDLLDVDGRPVATHGTALRGAARVEPGAAAERLRDARVVLVTDVDNPLLGEHGAAAVYGPQKGAGPAEVALLERELARWADALEGGSDRDPSRSGSRPSPRDAAGAGAAGGAAYGALAGLGADLVPGVGAVLDVVGFADAVLGADLVVTGEGSLDAQSLRGKAPVGVLAAATAAGLPTVAVCGRTTLTAAEQAAAGFAAVHAVTDREPDPARAMAQAAAHVAALGEQVADRLASLASDRRAGGRTLP